MAHTAARTHRTTVRSKRHAAASKKRISPVRKAASVQHETKTRSGASKIQRRHGKVSLAGTRKRGDTASASRKSTPAIQSKEIAPRGRASVFGAATRKGSAKSREKYGFARKLRAMGAMRRPAPKMTAEHKAPRRRRAAPRLWRCRACGTLVPWVSVDSRCFPCLKRGLSGRKREDEFAMGVFDIEEEFAPAVQ